MEIGPNHVTIRTPDDFHAHLRDGEIREMVVRFTAERFGRVIAMPNLTPPIKTWGKAFEYRERIKRTSGSQNLRPLMVAYLTDNTDPNDLVFGRKNFNPPLFYGAKFYPAGATTGSDNGVTDIEKIFGVLRVMEEIGIPLLIHGEKTQDDSGKEIPEPSRETSFLPTYNLVRRKFSKLPIVFEHVTTEEMVSVIIDEWRRGYPTASTITPHHLFLNSNDVYRNGRVNPFSYCKPVAKLERDRRALRKAAISGLPCFFGGTDSAPHTKEAKCKCGAAGIFNAPSALEDYTLAFEEEAELAKLENFLSRFGAEFYGLPLNDGEITIEKRPWQMPKRIGDLVPFRALEEIPWRIVDRK